MNPSHHANSRIIRLLALLALLASTACAGTGGKSKALDATLYAYAGAVRWSEFERAWAMVDPETRSAHPIDDVEWSRLELLQVTSYRVQSSGSNPDGDIEQVVQIGVINRHTQSERVVLANERWHWDENGKRWWLIAGFPDFSSGR